MTILTRIDNLITDLHHLRSAHMAQQTAIDQAQAGVRRWRLNLLGGTTGEGSYGDGYDGTIAWVQAHGFPDVSAGDTFGELFLWSADQPSDIVVPFTPYDSSTMTFGEPTTRSMSWSQA